MSDLLRQRSGHIETLTLNRPDSRNAVNSAISLGLSAAFDEIEEDDDCWVVIITASGKKAFCAGMDLKEFAAGEAGDEMGAKSGFMGASGGFAGITRRDFAKPVIAAINGPALAGGFEIMLSCDLVIAAEHATFGLPEVKRGLIAGGGGLLRLSIKIPSVVASELAMTGEPIDAHRALAIGLINKVVPAEALMDEAMAMGNTLVDNAPLAVRATKQLMKKASMLSDEEAWALNSATTSLVNRSADAAEGPRAFTEKRRPVWLGK